MNLSTLHLIAVTLMTTTVIATQLSAAAVTIQDDFTRPDGPLDNGWSQLADTDSPVVIKNQQLTVEYDHNGQSGITREIANIQSVRIRARIGDCNAYGPLGRFTSVATAFSSGNAYQGLGVSITRTSYGVNNSSIEIVHNGSTDTSQQVLTSFQFGDEIYIDVTITSAGSVSGTLISGSNTQNFSFFSPNYTLHGDAVTISQGNGDARGHIFHPMFIDDVQINAEVVNPIPAPLAVLVGGGITLLSAIRRPLSTRNIR